jgi:hypothetical protein
MPEDAPLTTAFIEGFPGAGKSTLPQWKILHTTRFDALMENCFFYISRMYEFLHRLGQTRRTIAAGDFAGCPL